MARKKWGTASKPGKKALRGKQDVSIQNRQRSWAANSERYVTSQSKTNEYNMRILGLTFSKVLAFFLIMTWLHGCIEIRSRDVHQRAQDPNEYRSVEDVSKSVNLHRGRWWNYYELGSRFLASGHHSEALKNFSIAINKRDKDTRDARTYGMHFIDFFPHRESGVAYCLWAEEEKRDMAEKEKRFKSAMSELETSIKQEPSSKAKFYLKRATAGFWSVTNEDRKSPVVWIKNEEIDRWKNVPTLYINGYAAMLEIQASDDQSGINTVWIDDKKLFVESAEKVFNESAVITIDSRDKEKTVVVRAVDLAGNESQPAKVRFIVDTTPPMAAIKVRSDRVTLFGGRIPVDVNAVDNEGLKSVRVGDDPYDNRDCRGQSIWGGRFFAEPGINILAVEIADSAGNVTAISVNIEPKRAMSIGRSGPLLANNIPLSHSQNLWISNFDLTQRDSTNIFSNLKQYSTLQTHGFPSLLGYESVQGSALTEYKPPELLLSDVTDNNTLVSTSHPRYLLQGQVKNADGLEYITITVDGEKHKTITVEGEGRQHEKVMKHGDHVIFSAWVTLPDYNDPNYDEPLPIAVNAHFDGKNNPPSAGLQVQRVRNCLLESESKYSVILLPLEDEHQREHYKQWDQANNIVCEAVRGYKNLEPNSQKFYQRFDCQYLDKWKASRFQQWVVNYYANKKEPLMAIRKASEIAAAKGVDLAIYGSFEDEGDKFEVKVQFTDTNYSPLSNKVIDMYGSYKDYNYYIEGLTSKFKEQIPRISGPVDKINPDERVIEVNLGKKHNIFNKMDLLLYDVYGSGENTLFKERCNAKANVTDVSVKRFSATVVGECSWWPSIVKRCKEGKDVRVISK